MDNKALVIFGGIAAVGLVALLYSKSQSTSAANLAYENAQLASQTAVATSTGGQISSVLSSVGSLFGGGSIGSLFQSFGASTPGNNDAGLEDASDVSDYSNDPGLDDVGDYSD